MPLRLHLNMFLSISLGACFSKPKSLRENMCRSRAVASLQKCCGKQLNNIQKINDSVWRHPLQVSNTGNKNTKTQATAQNNHSGY